MMSAYVRDFNPVSQQQPLWEHPFLAASNYLLAPRAPPNHISIIVIVNVIHCTAFVAVAVAIAIAFSIFSIYLYFPLHLFAPRFAVTFKPENVKWAQGLGLFLLLLHALLNFSPALHWNCFRIRFDGATFKVKIIKHICQADNKQYEAYMSVKRSANAKQKKYIKWKLKR